MDSNWRKWQVTKNRTHLLYAVGFCQSMAIVLRAQNVRVGNAHAWWEGSDVTGGEPIICGVCSLWVRFQRLAAGEWLGVPFLAMDCWGFWAKVWVNCCSLCAGERQWFLVCIQIGFWWLRREIFFIFFVVWVFNLVFADEMFCAVWCFVIVLVVKGFFVF